MNSKGKEIIFPEKMSLFQGGGIGTCRTDTTTPRIRVLPTAMGSMLQMKRRNTQEGITGEKELDQVDKPDDLTFVKVNQKTQNFETAMLSRIWRIFTWNLHHGGWRASQVGWGFKWSLSLFFVFVFVFVFVIVIVFWPVRWDGEEMPRRAITPGLHMGLSVTLNFFYLDNE